MDATVKILARGWNPFYMHSILCSPHKRLADENWRDEVLWH